MDWQQVVITQAIQATAFRRLEDEAANAMRAELAAVKKQLAEARAELERLKANGEST